MMFFAEGEESGVPAQGRKVPYFLSQPIPTPEISLFFGWVGKGNSSSSSSFLRMSRRKKWELPGAKKASGQSFPAS